MWRLKKKLFIILIFLFLFFILFSIILKSKENENIEDNLTVVSGFWKIKNKHGSKYEEEWFKNSLMINQKYVFFTSPDLIDSMKTFRTNYETIFIPYELNNFYSDKIHPLKTLHKDHVPSKELAAIWNEKIHLLKIAKDFDLKNNNLKEFYIWIDAGVCTFRNQAPPQKRLNISQSLLKTLPKNKFIYSSLEGINTDEFLEFLHLMASLYQWVLIITSLIY